MTELKPRIHDESNGLDYVLVGDYYVPDLKLPEEHRPIGMWGRLHRTYLEQYHPARFSALCLSGELHTYLADLNEQATERCSLIIEQMKHCLLYTSDAADDLLCGDLGGRRIIKNKKR